MHTHTRMRAHTGTHTRTHTHTHTRHKTRQDKTRLSNTDKCAADILTYDVMLTAEFQCFWVSSYMSNNNDNGDLERLTLALAVKFTFEKKILQLLLRDSNLPPFDHESGALTLLFLVTLV